MNERQPEHDTPVEIKGYKTDPFRRGYQQLWNYESTYWRSLVGNDAWSLYEVLRSFCHEGNNTCRPSINLLIAILGLKQRRVLTGWVTKTNGKEYRYPGLIEILQRDKLATAEIKGDGPKMRYIFHVNLTPGMLTDAQLEQLPLVLQNKHTELLQRCEQAKRELAAKQRPSKVSQKVDKDDREGYDNLSEGYDKLPEGYDNLSPEHYPYNNTQRTTTKNREENNSSDEPDPKQAVVVALINKGISQKVAQRLASRYKRERIFQKIDYLEYVLETNPDKVKNPQGWLRRAIEENFGEPDGYKSREERESDKKARQEALEEQEHREAARRAQEEAEQAKWDKLRKKDLQANKARYQTSDEEIDLWSEVLDQIKSRTDDVTFQPHLAKSTLLSLKNKQATIWIPLPGGINIQLVNKRYGLMIRRLLAKHLNTDFQAVTLNWVAAALPEEPDEPSLAL
jgi:hypothetical protein